jgi:trimeric autotransporter adhesin
MTVVLKLFSFTSLVLSLGSTLQAQVGIGTTTPASSAKLEISSTTQGFLPPRMTSTQRADISSPATGLVVYQTDGATGLYLYNGSAWSLLTISGWSASGNSGLSATTNFIGTTDAVPFSIRYNNIKSGKIDGDNTTFGYYSGSTMTGLENTGIGQSALRANTTGNANSALGHEALKNNTTGSYNVSLGRGALQSNINGGGNTAIGWIALMSNTSGNSNIAVGQMAMQANTTGESNIALGYQSLKSNTTGGRNFSSGAGAMYSNVAGSENIAIGFDALRSNNNWRNIALGSAALYSNTTGEHNIGIGFNTLYNNLTASQNVAVGDRALYSNVGGYQNIGIGAYSLYNNASGYRNTAIGVDAQTNTTGNNNTSVGMNALNSNTSGSGNTAIGAYALYDNNTTGFGNTAIGYYARVSSSALQNATSIGYNAVVNASNKIRLGDANISVIEGQVAFSNPSDGRFKRNVSESDLKGLDFIKRLRPVVYNFDTRKYEEHVSQQLSDSTRNQRLKENFSASTNIRHSGFIAQEVEKAAIASGYDFDGLHLPEQGKDYYSLSYSQFVVPLIKGMQEQQALIEGQQKMIDKQQEEINELKKMVKEFLKHRK